MPRLTGGAAVVDSLEREGVDVVFGIPGVHTLDIYDALLDSDLDHVTTRHEQGAGFMADGYARTTGRVGVLLVITGPGLTNAATAIGQAYSDSSPLLVVSSTHETTELGRERGHLHELKDQSGLMENLVDEHHRVEGVGDVHGTIADAFDRLRSRRPRPVHVEIPLDVLGREEAVDPVTSDGSNPPRPDEERISEAAEMLASADRPLLVVGGGAAGAADGLRRLAESLQAPVVSTVAGKGVVPADHDLFVGAGFRGDGVQEFVAGRDLALAVGTELSPQDTRDVDLPELVHVDIDYTNFGKNYPCALGIVGEAAETVGALRTALEAREATVDPGSAPDLRGTVADLRPDAPMLEAEDNRHRILAALRDALDDDAVVVGDMTKLCYEASRTFPALEPDTFLFPRGFGTLGFAPPAAYGAALGAAESGSETAARDADGGAVRAGDGDRQVIALVGDGGFLFTVQDLATAVKYDLSVPVVVLNDESYDVVREVQERDYGRSVGTDIENPSFVEMAESFGAAARRVDVDDVGTELPAALSAAFERDGPTVVELPVAFS